MIESDSCTEHIVVNADQVRQLGLHFNTSTFVSEAKSSLLYMKNSNHFVINSVFIFNLANIVRKKNELFDNVHSPR